MTEDNKCPCEEMEKISSCGNAPLLPETLRALTELVNAICNCGCGGDNGDGDGDGDGDGPGTGDGDGDGDGGSVGSDCGCDGDLLDTNMSSDEGNEEFKPIASSSHPSCRGMWPAFKSTSQSSKDAYDVWLGLGETPHYFGVETKNGKYVFNKVVVVLTTYGVDDRAIKEFKLQYRNDSGEWADLTDILTSTERGIGKCISITIPENKRIPASGIRLYMYSFYTPNGATVPCIGRMRLCGEKVE